VLKGEEELGMMVILLTHTFQKVVQLVIQVWPLMIGMAPPRYRMVWPSIAFNMVMPEWASIPASKPLYVLSHAEAEKCMKRRLRLEYHQA
jgi:hypothetical protein